MLEGILRKQPLPKPEQYINNQSIQEPKSISDIADAFNFFNKIYSDNTKL